MKKKQKSKKNLGEARRKKQMRKLLGEAGREYRMHGMRLGEESPETKEEKQAEHEPACLLDN